MSGNRYNLPPGYLNALIPGASKYSPNNGYAGAPYSPSGGLAPGGVNLRTAGNFAILTKSGITNVGGSTINGDMGVSPIAASAITGFALTLDASNRFSTSAQVIGGKVYAADYASPTPSYLTQAILDMQAAYTDAASRTPNFTNEGAGSLNGLTLTPGVHSWTTNVTLTAGALTLSGNANDVFIMQITGNLTIGAGRIVGVSGSMPNSNIFWQVSGTVSLGNGCTMAGEILCFNNIAMVTNATIGGRLFAQTAVALDHNTVTPPALASGLGSQPIPARFGKNLAFMPSLS